MTEHVKKSKLENESDTNQSDHDETFEESEEEEEYDDLPELEEVQLFGDVEVSVPQGVNKLVKELEELDLFDVFHLDPDRDFDSICSPLPVSTTKEELDARIESYETFRDKRVELFKTKKKTHGRIVRDMYYEALNDILFMTLRDNPIVGQFWRDDIHRKVSMVRLLICLRKSAECSLLVGNGEEGLIVCHKILDLHEEESFFQSSWLFLTYGVMASLHFERKEYKKARDAVTEAFRRKPTNKIQKLVEKFHRLLVTKKVHLKGVEIEEDEDIIEEEEEEGGEDELEECKKLLERERERLSLAEEIGKMYRRSCELIAEEKDEGRKKLRKLKKANHNLRKHLNIAKSELLEEKKKSELLNEKVKEMEDKLERQRKGSVKFEFLREEEKVGRISDCDELDEIFHRNRRRLLDVNEKVNRLNDKIILRKQKLKKQNKLCSICCERPKNTVLVPCGHALYCAECSFFVELCPHCRRKIEKRVTMFQ